MSHGRSPVQDVTRDLNRLVFIVHEGCNLHCGYCYARLDAKGGTRRRMSAEVGREIVRRFANVFPGWGMIQFFGGEPTLNIECIEAVIEEVYRQVDSGALKGLPRFAIVTNGVLTSPLSTVNLLKRHHVETTVSLDGPPQVHDVLRPDVRGAPTQKRATRSVDRLSQAGVRLAIETVYTALHLTMDFSVADVLGFCEDLGIEKLFLSNAYPPCPPNLNPLLDPHFPALVHSYEQGVDAWFERLYSLRPGIVDVYFKDLLLPMLEGLPAAVANDGCPGAYRDFAIGPEGDAFPCQLLYGDPLFRLGNVLMDDLPFPDHWLPTSRGDFASCLGCSIRHWCQPCGALNQRWGNAFRPFERECTLRKAVVSRIANHALEKLDLPKNTLTAMLRDSAIGLNPVPAEKSGATRDENR